MLAYFPQPYPDELLYSVVARYAVHTGQDNQKAVIRDIFGSNSAAAVPDMPSHIDRLISSTKAIWRTSPEHIISQNTLAPFYLPFLAPEKADSVVNSMRSAQGGDIHTRAGIAASSIKRPIYFRYCPKCVEEQIKVYGEPYWKRQNQVTGLRICSDHMTKLINSDVEFHPKSKHLFVPAALVNLTQVAECLVGPSKELQLNKHVEILLNNPINIRLTHWQWTLFYRSLAKHHGLLNGTRTDHSAINILMKDCWHSTSVFASIPFEQSENFWLANIFRKHRKSFYPIRHVMVWVALAPDLSTTEILSQVANYPVQPERRKQFTLLPASDQEISIKRVLWRNLIIKNPDCGVKRIRGLESGSALYTWLYRHDYNWLIQNKPRKSVNPPKNKTDYEKLDSFILNELVTIKSGFHALNDRPRLSRTFLLRQLARYSSIEKYLKRLPITREWLEKESESIEDFQIYRLSKIALGMRKSGRELQAWKLMRAAGLKQQKIPPRIYSIINSLVSEKILK